jgi:hypothetical protein
MFSFFVF